jgi:hypothetical protein
MSEQNVELTRRAFEYAEQHGGVPDWDLMARDVVIVNLPDAPWQPSPGIKGMREWIAFAEDVAEEFVMEVDEIEDLGEDLVLVSGRLRMKFRATGLEQEAAIVQLCSIVDGKLKRLEAHYTREQALEAAGLSG